MDAPASPPNREARLVLAILACDDVARLRDFYVAAFGWRVEVEVPVYVELSTPGGMRVGLYLRGGFARNTGAPPAPAPAHGTTSTELYVRVADVAAALARLAAAGARVLSPPASREWGEVVAYTADPEGNVVAVACPTA